jgi:SAM-dependent methyltransferase
MRHERLVSSRSPTGTVKAPPPQGLRGFLRYASMFDLLQRLMGFPYEYAAEQIIASIPDDPTRRGEPVILDVGCGTARVLAYLEGVRYIGLEPSQQYVASARAHFPDTEFLPVRFQDLDASTLRGHVDVVVAIGVLHHITDLEVLDLARTATDVLRPGGTFFSLDPAFVSGQHGLARLLARNDRGEHVRTPAHLASLIDQVFSRVDTEVRDDLRRYPYTQVLVRAKA